MADALRYLHPDWEVGAVWCGDPYSRPQLDGVDWLDGGSFDTAGEVAIVAGDPEVGEWKRAVAAAAALLAGDVDRVVMLWVGSVAVLGKLDLLVDSEQPLTLVARAVDRLPGDGLVPTEADLIAAGPYSTTAVSMTGKPVVVWLAAQLTGGVSVGHLLARAAQLFGAHTCAAESIGVGPWRWPDAEPVLLDVPAYDTTTPWTLDGGVQQQMRIELLGHPSRQTVMERASAQLAGERTQLCLPGGIAVDHIMRRVVADATGCPPPWSASAEFREWLSPRYWRALHESRSDLQAVFPDPGGRSAEAFHQWCRGAFSFDDAPFLLATPDIERSPLVVADTLRGDGLNLVGYLTRQSGLSDVARRIGEGLSRAGIARSEIASQRTASPSNGTSAVANRVEFTNSLCVVTADQFPFLAEDFPELFSNTRRMIGYWFWELEHVPLHMRQSIGLVDEIWAGSRFVTDAFAAVSPVPVHHVPIPVAEPTPSHRSRADFPLLAGTGDRPIFLTVFDHLSVTERKNPLGVIDAFRQAFAPGEGPSLVIKTMNGHQRWSSHLRVLAAADGRDDIVVWDENLQRADQMALVAMADCMVSLHRSEGLGLHLAEAMWLETPTIATRYSGNLDFMTDDNSLLVDAEMVNIENGEGVYPTVAKWAEPDRRQAAAAMRRIAGDASLAARLG
ncbi:MAG: glycosyltransferase, partial [Ilumatobacteraceae bacterium]